MRWMLYNLFFHDSAWVLLGSKSLKENLREHSKEMWLDNWNTGNAYKIQSWLVDQLRRFHQRIGTFWKIWVCKWPRWSNQHLFTIYGSTKRGPKSAKVPKKTSFWSCVYFQFNYILMDTRTSLQKTNFT